MEPFAFEMAYLESGAGEGGGSRFGEGVEGLQRPACSSLSKGTHSREVSVCLKSLLLLGGGTEHGFPCKGPRSSRSSVGN